MMTCECEVCQDLKRWQLAIESDDVKIRLDAFAEMFSRIEEAETDASYYRAILQGEWPGAEKMLERSLNEIRMKNGTSLSEPPQSPDTSV